MAEDTTAIEQAGKTETQESMELTADAVSGQLENELLGLKLRKDMHWPEGEVEKLQENLTFTDNQEEIDQENRKLVEAFENSEYGRRIKAMEERTFNQEQLTGILNIVDALDNHTEIADAIIAGSYQFQRKRMEQLHVSNGKIDIALKHEQDVEKMAAKGGNFLRILASMHDQAKTIGEEIELEDGTKGYKDKEHLAAHEKESALLASDSIRIIFDMPAVKKKLQTELNLTEDQWETLVQDLADVAEIIISDHGHQEFPDKVAKFNPIDADKGLFRLFGNQLYVDKYRTTRDTVEADVNADTLARFDKLKEGLREADMAVGLQPGDSQGSWVKYHTPVSGEDLLKRNSSYEYISSFSPTMIEYLHDMPDVLKLRAEVEEDFDRGRLAILVLKAINQGQDDVRQICEQVLNGHTQNLFNQAQEMNRIFEQGKTGQKDPATVKQEHLDKFKLFMDEIYKIEAQKLAAPEIKVRLDELQKELEGN